MALLQDNPQLTRRQLANTLGKDLRTISRAITKLQHARKLKRVGSDKTGHWEVLL
ncbi:winged helix-turn-helix transcriptional regulator [Methylocucumis oryzae]|uniref:winged helix-turn-helix transcriptional regulator n=1 Tax=Methylocucumis oryzae TaxID=1632867 RepID=UPI001EF9DD13|nr:winged helix-turn-helix transcriptional regulator [Methylocucumis oryzae]